MIRKLLAALLFVCMVTPVCASAAPLDDLPAVATAHSSASAADSTAPAAPAADSPMLASAAVIGVAGLAAGKTLLSYRPGDRVTYVDEGGVAHNALVERWWGFGEYASCNLRYFDSGGFEHVANSVSCRTNTTPGRYWQPEGEDVAGVSDPDPEPRIKPISPPLPKNYRPLSDTEVELMDEVKTAFDAVGAVLDKLGSYTACPAPTPNDPPGKLDGRCLAIARTEAQTAAMWACRAITRPGGFA